jgi:hypothetical protein
VFDSFDSSDSLDRFDSFVRFDSIDRSIESNESKVSHAIDVYVCRCGRAPSALDAAMRVVRLDAVARRGDASSVRRARSRRARATASTRRRATARRRDDDDDDDARAATTLLDELARARDAGDGAFDDLVRARRDGLTVTFFDVAEARVRALERGGRAAEARALDETCAAAAARAEYAMDEIIANAAIALPGAMDETTTETGLTMAQGEELRRRWGAMASALATTGESNAAKQSALNETSRRNAITEIAGRAKIGAKEFESLKSVAPERRIAEVLLTIPRGAERAAAVEDALTPPADGEDLGGDEENEDVFTTAPRLLNVLEGMARERRTDGEDDSELCELIEIVERKCDV